MKAVGLARLALLAATMALVACSSPGASAARDPRAQEPSPGAGVEVSLAAQGAPLPPFELVTLEGQPIRRSDWRNKVIVLNFWATWCGPCRAEIPDLIALQERYHDSLIVIGLSVDEGPASMVKAFAQDQHINYPVAIVGYPIQDQFGGIRTVPTTFVLNRDGGVVQRHRGLANAVQLEQEVRVLSGFRTAAAVNMDPDLGRTLLTDPKAFISEIPGLDLSGLTADEKAAVVKELNADNCTCGCSMNVAECRVKDPGCATSSRLAPEVVRRIRSGR